MPDDEPRTRQPGTTEEEWEGGFIPSHSSRAVPRRKRNVGATPPSELPAQFHISLTPDEWGQLSAYAGEVGLTMRELVRRLIHKELARGRPKKRTLAVQEQLGRSQLTALERRVIWGYRGRGGTSPVRHWGPDVHLVFQAQEKE